MIHLFDVDDAVKYGLEKSIILYNFRFWLEKEFSTIGKGRGKGRVEEYNGKYYVWTFNSSSSLIKLFPYLKDRSIRRWIQEMEKDGIIISSNFNKKKYDKTKWYTLPEYEVDEKALAKMANRLAGVANASAKMANLYQIVNTDSNTNTNVLGSEILPFNLDSETTNETGKDNSALAKKVDPKDINKVLSVWNKFNPAVGYVNKGQRNAVEAMLGAYTVDEAIDYVNQAISVQGEQFAPSITTPYELRSKNIKLQQFLERRNL